MGIMVAAGVFLGGGVGSLLRAVLLNILGGSHLMFSVGVVVVNVIGSGLLGYISGSVSPSAAADWKLMALTVGVLGGLTTFSTYSMDIVKWFQNGAILYVLSFVLLNNLLSLVACYCFYQLARLNAV